MPGKVNPVMAEMLNMVMIQITAMDYAVNTAAAAGQLGIECDDAVHRLQPV